MSPAATEMVPFNRATLLGTEVGFVRDAAGRSWMSGGGHYSQLCEGRFRELLGCAGAFLTPSCTAALEMAALILDVGPGEEVILPSYTFVTSASAFVIFGARAVFVDVDPATMNIDPDALEAAITPKTKAIVAVHYGGNVCDMAAICAVADRFGLPVIEDAAQAIGATRGGQMAGSFGAMAAFSFHETKNITSGGEGGLLVVNDQRLMERARIAQEKGTNRAAFREGVVDKYSWVGRGSSYLMNEISAAWLWAQLDRLAEINGRRLQLYDRYFDAFAGLADAERITLPQVPTNCTGNGHMFYLKLRGVEERRAFLQHLEGQGVQGTFHYVPLHSSPAGRTHGRFEGRDDFTSRDADRLVRLPLFYNLTADQQEQVVRASLSFFQDATT